MEYIIEELRRDSSNGHTFTILFGEKITLEQAVEKLLVMLPQDNGPQDHFVSKESKYGHIKLKHGELFIKDERTDVEKLRDNYSANDTYRVTENNMSFDQLEELYLFLQNR
ncbi:MAG: hypothetical protein AABX03_00280 [Nanoarchaeota archaeon]